MFCRLFQNFEKVCLVQILNTFNALSSSDSVKLATIFGRLDLSWFSNKKAGYHGHKFRPPVFLNKPFKRPKAFFQKIFESNFPISADFENVRTFFQKTSQLKCKRHFQEIISIETHSAANSTALAKSFKNFFRENPCMFSKKKNKFCTFREILLFWSHSTAKMLQFREKKLSRSESVRFDQNRTISYRKHRQRRSSGWVDDFPPVLLTNQKTPRNATMALWSFPSTNAETDWSKTHNRTSQRVQKVKFTIALFISWHYPVVQASNQGTNPSKVTWTTFKKKQNWLVRPWYRESSR